MKSILSCVLLLLLATADAGACNVCGCSASNQYLGILPQFYNHFIGFQYQYRSFNSEHPPLKPGGEGDKSKEYYNTYQVWGRYNVNKRVQLFAFVPYHQNVQVENGVTTTTTGVGDISLLANYAILKADKESDKDLQQTLLAGGGVKLPTGKYVGITQADKEGLPNIQPGTGSWDFILDANYTLRYKKVGVNVDAAYTITTANRDEYKYGNRLNSSLLGFYWWQKGKVKLLPQAGVRYEFTLHDYDNYPRKWLNEQTGGTMFFASVGGQGYYGRWGLQFMYHIPLAQHYADGNVTTIARLETGVFFLF